MLHATIFGLTAATLVRALSLQVPLGSNQHGQDEHHPTSLTLDGSDLAEWSFDKILNHNNTDNLVFETVHSLLQHWPNTRMRNGHNIVPGVIPKGTLLYHGGPDNELPTSPEWIGTDPEHSYLFCRNMFTPSDGCWHFNLVATRPLKIVYFDGSSAAGVADGPMDTQDLIIWGRSGDVFEDEMERAEDLCKWGKNFDIDGFVRMEMDFEIMFCDFSSGLRVVSSTKLASKWTGELPISGSELFEVIHAGTWHSHFPGETRIQLDLSGLVSFYDTQIAPSLVPIRAGQERWDHRVLNISTEDLLLVRARLETNLMRPHGASSRIDWKTLVHVVVDRYAQRLELTRYLVNSSATNPDEMIDLAKKTQTQLRIMLTPYIHFSAMPTNLSNEGELDWAVPIYKLCSTAHTAALESLIDSMTDSDKLILQAVRGTNREICRVLTKMWASGVYAGVDRSLNTKGYHDIDELARLQEIWEETLSGLMAWLDWNVWVKCNPGCAAEEMCYLPTWPIGFPWLFDAVPLPQPFPPSDDYMPRGIENSTTWKSRRIVMKGLADKASKILKIEPDEWIRPQPKCIRRIKPYTY